MGAKVKAYGGRDIFERTLKHGKMKRSELERLLDQKKAAKEKLTKTFESLKK